MDERHGRGQMAVVGLVFIGSVIAGALIYVFLQQAWSPLIDMAGNHSSTNASQEGLNTVAKPAWNNWAMWVLLLSFVLGIAGAAANARRK